MQFESAWWIWPQSRPSAPPPFGSPEQIFKLILGGLPVAGNAEVQRIHGVTAASPEHALGY
jgi:hypothetical protein